MESIENKYFNLIVSKTYFDCYAHEFKNKTIQDKLVNLALYLKEGGDLHHVIKLYKIEKSEHTLNSLIPTLLYYIEYIRTGEKDSILSVLLEKYLSEFQLISLLSAELKVNLSYGYENYDVNSPMKKIYKINTGEYVIEKFLNQDNLSKKEILISILKGNLPNDFELGDFDENVPD
jgi:hypothetical protein